MEMEKNLEENFITKSSTTSTKKKTKSIIIPILIGQGIAILGVVNGLASTIIENNYKLQFPITLTLLYYLTLFLVYLSLEPNLKKPSKYYFLIALFDSQGNMLNIYAFTKLRFSFPFIINFAGYTWTLIITFIFIKAYKYSFQHLYGSLLSIVGIALSIVAILFSDQNNDEIYFNLLGFFMCIVASFCYSLSSILQEMFLPNESVREYFKWLGLSGFILLLIEGFIFGEIIDLFQTTIDVDVYLIIVFIVFLGSIIIFTSIVPYFIMKYSASVFGISLLFQIFWSYLIDILMGKQLVSQFI